jgi:hypothetical protein
MGARTASGAVTVRCGNCKRYNEVPAVKPPAGQRYRCGNCGAFLKSPEPQEIGAGAAIGAAGGAALGAAMAGPPGALIGLLVGAVLGAVAEGK